jgi:hypothetical protein
MFGMQKLKALSENEEFKYDDQQIKSAGIFEVSQSIGFTITGDLLANWLIAFIPSKFICPRDSDRERPQLLGY